MAGNRKQRGWFVKGRDEGGREIEFRHDLRQHIMPERRLMLCIYRPVVTGMRLKKVDVLTWLGVEVWSDLQPRRIEALYKWRLT